MKLKSSRVIVIGAGGIGTPVLQYLAAAGVGEICICDADYVNETNFPRQIMYGASDLGKLKTIVAKEKLQLLNPLITFTIKNIYINEENIETMIEDFDVVADCSNNTKARHTISTTCKRLNKPLVYGAICNFEGIIGVFNYKLDHKLEAAPQAPLNANDNAKPGIIGVIPGIVGCLMASEMLKILLEYGESMSGKFLLFNNLNQEFKTITLGV